MNQKAYPAALPGGGALVGDRTYDMAVTCTGLSLPPLDGGLSYFPVEPAGATLATVASPVPSYRVGPAAGIPLSPAEKAAGINYASAVAMFRLTPRTAALAAMLPAVSA
jgi:hypothetical protein